MRPIDLLRLALRNACRGGIKALLCAGAVCIGICSVCTVRGIGGAARIAISQELEELGVGGLVFYSSDQISIGAEDAALVEQIQGVTAAMPFFYLKGTAKLNTIRFDAALCGVGEQLEDILDVKLLYGRLPQRGDIASAARVAILDEQTAKKVYARENIVGKEVLITAGESTASFEIIGIIRSQKMGLEALTGGNLPLVMYVPYTALNELAEPSGQMLAVACLSDVDTGQVIEAVQRKLKYTLNAAFSYEDLNQYAGSIQKITSAVTALISGVAAISIFVGGLGVMNSMVAVVDARVGEIGIWLALGARRRSIAACYLLEALCICLVGGLFGAGLSAVALLTLRQLVSVSIPIHAADLLIGVAGAAACGMIFGLLPALRAARMNPIDAIRTE